MKSEYRKGCIAVFCFLIVVFLASIIFAVTQVSAFKRAYNLKKYGREVQAKVIECYRTDAPNAYTAFVLVYEYRENDKTWGGLLQYSHREDDKFDETAWMDYYNSQIGSIVEITIYDEDNYCQLTNKVESSYNSLLLQEALCFCIGSIGFLITLILFIRFLKLNNTKENGLP